jgi:hypothetical protein
LKYFNMIDRIHDILNKLKLEDLIIHKSLLNISMMVSGFY